VRLLGAALAVIGTGLTLGMAYFISVIAAAMRRPAGGAGGSFTGTPRDAAFIFAILGFVLAFGVTSVSTGVWQLVFGRPNRVLSGAVLALGVVAVALAIYFAL
jgi:hypothetical protein